MPVEQAVKQASANAPVRVFTLGIGETTSSALCEGMARVGNGVCLMATTAETIIGKCSRLVRASRTYILKNVSVDWGVRTDLAEAYRTGNTEIQGVRQAPANVGAMYPGNRFIVFALVEDGAFVPPKEVVIRAQRDGHGEILQFSVPVQLVEFPPEHHPQPLIQTLAARRAIMDIEDSSRGFPSPDAKSLVVRLGTRYQLASKYTSFIAVDKRTKSEISRDVEEHAYTPPIPPDPILGAFPFHSLPQQSQRSFLTGILVQHTDTSAPRNSSLFGGYVGGGVLDSLGGGPPPATEATPRSQSSSFSSARTFPTPVSHHVSRERDREQLRGFSQVPRLATATPMAGGGISFGSGTNVSALSNEDKVFRVIRLQAFNGSFPVDQSLLGLLGDNISMGPAWTMGVPGNVWATALAIVWLRKHMAGQPELLDGIVDKAMEFLSQTSNVDVDVLLGHAQSVLDSTSP